MIGYKKYVLIPYNKYVKQIEPIVDELDVKRLDYSTKTDPSNYRQVLVLITILANVMDLFMMIKTSTPMLTPMRTQLDLVIVKMLKITQTLI